MLSSDEVWFVTGDIVDSKKEVVIRDYLIIHAFGLASLLLHESTLG